MSTNGDKPLRLEWMSPETLADNPSNWRKHPEAQTAGLTASIEEAGWAGALLYNARTGRLVDGHARKKLPEELMVDGKVPVLIGHWTEEQERLVLATLDPLAAMAEADEQKLGELLRQIETEPEGLQAALEAVADQHGLQDSVEDYSEQDEQNEALAGQEDTTVYLTVPVDYVETVQEWLANGEPQTGAGRGRGVLKRCGLL